MKETLELVFNNGGCAGFANDVDVEEGDILVNIDIEIPDEFFEPLKIIVNIPKEYAVRAGTGEMKAVEVPVMLYEQGPAEIKDELRPAGEGILAMLKRTIFRKE